MSGFGDYLAARREDPSLAALRGYLANITSEDWGAEFKRATNGGDFQIRKAVASMGNHGGGELFVGVEDDKRVTGTSLTVDQLYALLRQAGPSEDWYTLDLSTLVVGTRTITLADAASRALVVEVRAALLPNLVVDDAGGLVWFERRGRSDHTLSPKEWVDSLRRFGRGRLLLELYQELSAAVMTLPQFTYGQPIAGAHFTLPRYEAAKRDGTVFSVLSASDRNYLHASAATNQSGFAAPGLLARFQHDGARLDRQIEAFSRSGRRDWDMGPGTELRIAGEVWKQEVVRFREYLESLGVLPRAVAPSG